MRLQCRARLRVIAKLTLTQAFRSAATAAAGSTSWSLYSLSLITTVTVVRRVGREAAGARRTPSSRARVLVTTTISTGTSRHLDIAIALRRHGRTTKAILRVTPPAATGAWSKWGLVIGRISWHRRRSRVRTTLRCHWPRTTVLRKAVAGGRLRVARGLGLLGRINFQLASWWTVLAPLQVAMVSITRSTGETQGFNTHAAFKRTSIDIVATELTNRHSRVLVAVHFDKSEPSIRLEARLDHEPEVLEEGNKVILSCVRCEVADVASSLPLGSLLHNHIVALDPMGGEVVVTIGCRWSHAHSCHSLLL